MKKFDFKPRGDVKRTIRYLDRTIDFETGTFQVQRVGVNPIITFEGTYEGTGASLKDLENFYLEHRKTERFLFEYDGKEYTCQFTSDYSPTDTWGWSQQGRIIAKTSVTLSMRVINI